jgi:glycosyltransferase involved in cell wall biosynthesis
MRILHLSTDSYGGYGGIALYNRDVIEALTLHPKCEEVVVLPRIVPQAVEALPPKVTFMEEASHGALAYTTGIRRARKRGPYDLVICGHINLLPVARMFTRHSLLFAYGIETWRPLRPMSTRLLHSVSGIVSISEITRARLLEWSRYAGKTYLLPNAIHAEKYGIRPRSNALLDRYRLHGKRVLLTVGRIVAAERYKGFDEVLEVLPELPEDVVYLLAGGGNDSQRLAMKAAALGLGGRVFFTGLFAESEKADLYSIADVYVMPSRGEGFGFVLLEALAAGVPVIASKHDGGREAVRHGELGLLVDPASRAELKAAILEILARGNERHIQEGLDYFSFANFTQRLHAIVEDAMLTRA